MHYAYFGFFCSINHLSRPLRKHMFTCTSSKSHGLWLVIGEFWSVLFVSHFKVHCFVIVLFRAIIDQFSLLCRFLWSFSFLLLARIKQHLPPSLTINPLTIAISFAILEQSRVILSQAGQAHYIVICIILTPPSLIWLTEQKNPKSPLRLQNTPRNTTNFAVST